MKKLNRAELENKFRIGETLTTDEMVECFKQFEPINHSDELFGELSSTTNCIKLTALNVLLRKASDNAELAEYLTISKQIFGVEQELKGLPF